MSDNLMSSLSDVAIEINALSYEDMKELGVVLFRQVYCTLENHGDRDEAAKGEFSWDYFSDTLKRWADDYLPQDES